LKLQLEAPTELTAVRMRLEALPPGSFNDIAQFLGISSGIAEPGPAIHVVLAPETVEPARNVPQWISGFAVGESSLVVLFPARSPGYPDQTLEDVLRHEVAHVLIWRAAAGHPVPRWFDEGVAMEVERQRRWQDQTQLFYQLMTAGQTDLQHLDRLFASGQNDQTRAYALAGAFVHDLLKQHGPETAKDILMQVHSGAEFDTAFTAVTGSSPSHAEADFWHRQRIWTSWVPIISSTTTLWLGVTLLALLAIYMRRRRNRAIEEAWEKEDSESDDYN
jgi:LPXTG-motif cell wall-anchored protein